MCKIVLRLCWHQILIELVPPYWLMGSTKGSYSVYAKVSWCDSQGYKKVPQFRFGGGFGEPGYQLPRMVGPSSSNTND